MNDFPKSPAFQSPDASQEKVLSPMSETEFLAALEIELEEELVRRRKKNEKDAKEVESTLGNITDADKRTQKEQAIAWLKSEAGIKRGLLNNLPYSRLPGHRVIKDPEELNKRIHWRYEDESKRTYSQSEIALDQQYALNRDPKWLAMGLFGGHQTKFYEMKTWNEYYQDIDNALLQAGLKPEQLEEIREMNQEELYDYVRNNIAPFYEAYKVLRRMGYSSPDLVS